jgi:aminoglycoside phosphotransferase (APT) family kinase protein
MPHHDRPQAVRPGEALPVDRLETYLKDTLTGMDGPLTIAQYPSGASNLTYRITCGERYLVLRRPPFGTKAATAHDMGREYKVLSALSAHWPYAPRPLKYCDDADVIGSPFYLMEHCQGIILRREIPAGILDSPAKVRALFERFVEILVELHTLDYAAIGLEDLGKPQGYVERQVHGWCKRFRAARTPDMPDCEEIMAWLGEKMPAESARAGIIHNDYKFDNIVLDSEDPQRIIAVLDWEMTTIGDPLMDLGSTLGYWVEATDPPERHLVRTMPTHHPGALSRREFVDLYGHLSGLKMEDFDFYYCFGLFRLIVIIQQIYYRYYHGQTRNKRFKDFAKGIPVLEKAARGVISRSAL